MRIFGSERMDAMLKRLGLKEDEAIVHPWINKALEKAQQKVEARNFDMRKNILKFDNVMNDQRKVIFEDRRKMMAPGIAGADDRRNARRRHRRSGRPSTSPPTPIPRPGTSQGLKDGVQAMLNLDLPVDDWAKEEGIADEEMASGCIRPPTRPMPSASTAIPRRRCAMSKSRSSCRRSTIYGATIW
jgi:preprotein translocase subunit SecA